MPQLFLAPHASNASISSSQRKIVKAMLLRGVTFHEALREFQNGYISYVIAGHDGHLGRAASELGMHRNTLTRTLRQLR